MLPLHSGAMMRRRIIVRRGFGDGKACIAQLLNNAETPVGWGRGNWVTLCGADIGVDRQHAEGEAVTCKGCLEAINGNHTVITWLRPSVGVRVCYAWYILGLDAFSTACEKLFYLGETGMQETPKAVVTCLWCIGEK